MLIDDIVLVAKHPRVRTASGSYYSNFVSYITLRIESEAVTRAYWKDRLLSQTLKKLKNHLRWLDLDKAVEILLPQTLVLATEQRELIPEIARLYSCFQAKNPDELQPSNILRS